MCVVGSGSRRWSRGSSRIRIRAMPPPSESHYLLTGVIKGGLAVHARRAGALVGPDFVPCDQQERRVADEVGQVSEPASRIVGRPSVQFGLDAQYPRLRLLNGEHGPRRAGVHRRPPGLPVPTLRACCPPWPCGQLSCPRTTTGAPPRPDAVSRQRACPPPCWPHGGKGDTRALPTFTMCRSAGVVPSFSPAASPRLRRSPSAWPSSPHDWRGSKSPRTLTRCRRALLPGPHPPGWSRSCCLRGFHHWFTRRCTVPPCLPSPDRLAVPTRLDVVGAAPTRPLRFQGSGCPPLHQAAATAQRWVLASHPVPPRLVAHRHVPVQPGHLQPEGGDRPRPHRPDHLL